MTWSEPLGALVEGERPVVEGRREPETVLDEDPLARLVSFVLPVQLREPSRGSRPARIRKSSGKKSSSVWGGSPVCSAVEVPAVVLDPAADPDLREHLEVVAGPHPAGVAPRAACSRPAAPRGGPSSSISIDSMARFIVSSPAT